jgi:regulator of RNase E activity RraA
MMNQELLTLLQQVDTPTVCNAIEVAQGKRGFDQFTRGTMQASDPQAPAIVGYARTAKVSALRPSDDPVDEVKARRMAYYKHMAEGARPSIAVVEDVDFPDCVGAFWGEINTTVHRGFGVKGALTNGVMRDLGDLPSGFPVIAGSIGPSHAFVHVTEIGVPVNVFGLALQDGDLVHADRHGALVIPDDVIDHLFDAINKLMANEKLVLEPARSDEFDFDAFEKAWAAFEAART